MGGLFIRGGRLLDPGSQLGDSGDVLIRDGWIAAVGAPQARGDEQVLDAIGLLVCPGFMDIHVHLREESRDDRETIATGTAAAAMGGFTRVAAEPNTTPPRDTVERILEDAELASGDGLIQVLQKCCITTGQQGRQVTDMAALRAAGGAAASDDGFSVRDEAVMQHAFAAAKAAGLPLTLHVDGPEMVARDIGLAAEADWPVHFSHMSLEEEAELIAGAQSRGLRVTGEVTPHHLALCAADAPPGDANFKVYPPLRPRRDQEAMQKALAQGVISVIASDHAPHTLADKSGPYEAAAFGMIGLETTVGVVWTKLVHAGLLEAEAAAKAMTVGPASALGLEPPALREGARADVILLDPERRWAVDAGEFQSLGRNCPFSGWRLRGRVVATIFAGRLVMREGVILGRV